MHLMCEPLVGPCDYTTQISVPSGVCCWYKGCSIIINIHKWIYICKFLHSILIQVSGRIKAAETHMVLCVTEPEF